MGIAFPALNLVLNGPPLPLIRAGGWDTSFTLVETFRWAPMESRKYFRPQAVRTPLEPKFKRPHQPKDLKRRR